MVLAVDNSDIKCEFATAYANKRLEDEYMIKICATSILDVKSFEVRMKEKFLQALLLDNINFLNYRDECGKKVTNCDLNKIHSLK